MPIWRPFARSNFTRSEIGPESHIHSWRPLQRALGWLQILGSKAIAGMLCKWSPFLLILLGWLAGTIFRSLRSFLRLCIGAVFPPGAQTSIGGFKQMCAFKEQYLSNTRSGPTTSAPGSWTGPPVQPASFPPNPCHHICRLTLIAHQIASHSVPNLYNLTRFPSSIFDYVVSSPPAASS